MRLRLITHRTETVDKLQGSSWACWAICFLCLLFTLANGVSAQEVAPVTPPSREELQSRYEHASKLYGERKWHAAAEEFRWLGQQAANSLLGSYAMVYEAECLAEDGESERSLALLSNWLGTVAERVGAEGQGDGDEPSPERLLADRARLRIADLAQKLGNVELSIANYKVLAQSAALPDSKARALLAIGRFYQAKGEIAQADDHYSQVLQRPELSAFHDAARLGSLSLQLSAEGGEAAILGLRQIADKSPPSTSSAAAAFQLAQYYYKHGEFDSAVAMYDRVLALSTEPALLPYAYMGAANSLYQLGRKDEARQKLEQYIEQFPADPNWTQQVYQFIRWQLAVGDSASAEHWLERLHDIGFATNGEEIVWLRARSLLGRVNRQFNVAADALRSAILLSAEEEKFELQKELLAVLLEGGEVAAIDTELAGWIDAYKQSDMLEYQVFFEVKRFELLAQRRDWSTAAPLVLAWLKGHVDHAQKPDVLLVRAQCEIGTARIEDARATLNDEVFKSATTADRLKAQAMWLIGETYFLQKDYVAAVGAYSSVVQNFQDVKWKSLAMLQAGKCYEIVGQNQDAIQLYEEALKLSPADSVKKQIEARLGEVKQTRTSSLTPASRNSIPSR
jgi:TolA-binding protein